MISSVQAVGLIFAVLDQYDIAGVLANVVDRYTPLQAELTEGASPPWGDVHLCHDQPHKRYSCPNYNEC